MGAYIARRVLSGLLTLWVVTVVVSLLIHLVPGDPVRIMYAQSQSTGPEQIEAKRRELGLDELHERLVRLREVRFRVGAGLLRVVHQLRFGGALHGGESVPHFRGMP